MPPAAPPDTAAATPAGAPWPTAEGASPMLAQWFAAKARHADALLFFRMGDFYELFFADAEAAAAALDIALTTRGEHQGRPIPMCGVPAHSHESYLARLIRKGFRVAICEQMEDPAEAKKRGYKSIVRREVTRIITPGTITEEALLDAWRANWLAAVARDARGGLGLAWFDLSTGAFAVAPHDAGSLGPALARLDPAEILLPEALHAAPALRELWAEWRPRLVVQPPARFAPAAAQARLATAYGIATLDAFGSFTEPEVTAAGALLDYVVLTQVGKEPRLARLERQGAGAAMEIDAATRRNLELVASFSGTREGSLLGAIDRTVTAAGARLLAQRIGAPLTDPEAIGRRLDALDALHETEALRAEARAILRRAPDMARALSRLSLGRGGPRDLGALRDGLAAAAALRALLGPHAAGNPAIAAMAAALGEHGSFAERLGAALAEALPFHLRDGGFVAAGFSAELDAARSLRDETRKVVAGLQGEYARRAGAPSLKVKHNAMLGWFIELPAAAGEKLRASPPPDLPLVHRQTMAGTMRFATPELATLESRIAEAAETALALESAIFADLAAEALARAEAIAVTAEALAAIDVAAALAELAAAEGWCRPVVGPGATFRIEGGRHPVVEPALRAANGPAFVANDCDLSPAQRLWLLTGPNMAGKSTFLRQNALIAILAQSGSYVPARAAEIGIVDRLFSRVGAADDLARGRSTFMVEMVETAAILNQAGPRSLVILDEIGRGTATFDGLAIAWAVLEALHDANRCRALFATHFHELTRLAPRLPGLSCHAMRVKEWKGEIVFLHEVGPGAADRSYGVHVARLAGLPKAVLARAQAVLGAIEARAGGLNPLAEEMPLFAQATPSPPPPATTPAATGTEAEGTDGPVPPPPPAHATIAAELAAADPDTLTPRAALDLLYRLRAMLKADADKGRE
ncbi:MAG: DNA mismatch repair protein MutS [Alphaproteobacteria bacterium]|nr:DNA mismatch repair protein MutS [Alphaproteobacteria bacterium]